MVPFNLTNIFGNLGTFAIMIIVFIAIIILSKIGVYIYKKKIKDKSV
jgi:hypothetical protein